MYQFARHQVAICVGLIYQLERNPNSKVLQPSSLMPIEVVVQMLRWMTPSSCPPRANGLERAPELLPYGWHTLDIECKGVLSIGVWRLLVGNRVGVGLTRSTIRHLLPFLFPVKGARHWRSHGGKFLVTWIGQHPRICSTWASVPTSMILLFCDYNTLFKWA